MMFGIIAWHDYRCLTIHVVAGSYKLHVNHEKDMVAWLIYTRGVISYYLVLFFDVSLASQILKVWYIYLHLP